MRSDMTVKVSQTSMKSSQRGRVSLRPVELIHPRGHVLVADVDRVDLFELLNGFLLLFHRFKGRIPTGFVPIGCDPFGNLFLIQISGENHGKIFFWDHERETESPAMDNISFVADSFEAFVENLS